MFRVSVGISGNPPLAEPPTNANDVVADESAADAPAEKPAAVTEKPAQPTESTPKKARR